MPVNYQIHLDLGLVYVRYTGEAILDETMEAFGQYLQDSGFRPGQKQLVDLASVTGYERDYVKMMRIQAEKAVAFLQGDENLIVYYAPTELSRTLAEMILRSWSEIPNVVPILVTGEQEALTVLGLKADSLDGLQPKLAE